MNLLLFIIIIFIIIIVYIYIDFSLGRKHNLTQINRHNHAFRNTDFHLYRDGTELFPDLFSAIKDAKHHIHILFYTVKADSLSNEFLSLLEEKAKEGVEVASSLIGWAV
ncbi:hypothetical protein [Niallia sp. 01092]|uniref:hypothetical protein n=1 Tax=unclassified Niallia TaxID=2837522 RepID=UPI003FCFF1FA